MHHFAKVFGLLGYDVFSRILDRIYDYFDALEDKKILITGDSLSDSGSISYITRGFIPGPGYDEGVFSLGPIWSQVIASERDLDEVAFFGADSEELLEADVINTAIGSSTTGSASQALGSESGGTLWQLEFIEASGLDFSSDSVGFLWSGHNDFFIAANSGFPKGLLEEVEIAVNNTIEAVERMIFNLGIDDIVVIKMVPLDITPEIVAQGSDVVQAATQFVDLFNQGVDTALDQLHTRTQIDRDIIEVIDPGPLIEAVVDFPEFFGFENVTEPATNLFPGYTGTVDIVDNPDEFLFADGIHPGVKGHEILADIFGWEFGYREAIEELPFLERFVKSPIDLVIAAAEASSAESYAFLG